METQLKTLKDMRRYCYHDQARKVKTGRNVTKTMSHNMIKVYTDKDLRQEAIKWVKNEQKYSHVGNKYLLWWIKHFFNLTEEDLK